MSVRNRRIALAVAMMAGIASLSACSLGSMTPGLNTAKDPADAATASNSATSKIPKDVHQCIVQDMVTGSTHHAQHAGPVAVGFDYWTDQDMCSWDGSPIHISFAFHAKSDQGNKVRITQAKVTTSTGKMLLDDIGQFEVEAPLSYGSGFDTLPPTSTKRVMKLRIQVDLLVETTPTSGEFARQTVFDNLTLKYGAPHE